MTVSMGVMVLSVCPISGWLENMAAQREMEDGSGGARGSADAAGPDSKRRFSDRVGHYVHYRPGYPLEVVGFLRERGVLRDGSVVADVGSGTGISAELFLGKGCMVYGVEPNAEMRWAAERLLPPRFPSFRSVNGSAEATTLADASVDVVVAAQAFHWFDVEKARVEFRRILRPGGRVVLLWNTRRTAASAFLEAYERLLNEYGTDYRRVRHDNASQERVAAFFGHAHFDVARILNEQAFDLAGLEGRLMSSSYAPAPGHPRHEPMLRALRGIFHEFEESGRVRFLYDTEVYVGGFD
jgi:SAM-dependent methyltransferase